MDALMADSRREGFLGRDSEPSTNYGSEKCSQRGPGLCALHVPRVYGIFVEMLLMSEK